MKKLLVAVLALVAGLVNAQMQPVSNALRLDQRNQANSAYVSKFVPPLATGVCILTMNGADQAATPVCRSLGASLSIVDGAFAVSGSTGPQGPAGAAGANGADGKSAYQLAVDQGWSGTVSAWLASLRGQDGAPGRDGVNGAVGATGAAGPAGASITGPAGPKGDKGDTGATGSAGAAGPPGTTTWAGITDKPATYAPAAHTHAWTEITGRPTIPTINRARVVTATDGTYTWTMPTACSAAPVVSITPEGSADVFNHRVVSATATTVSISVTRSQVTAVSLLGLSVLAIPSTVGATPVHLIAICP